MQTSLTLKKNNINHKTSFSTINQRPSSANQRYPFINKTQSLKQSYKVIYTNPNNQKLFKGMGKTIDKEVTDVKDKNVVLILYNNVRDNYELEYLDVMGNITEKYKNHPEKKLKFTILNYHLNEPRDIDINEDYSFPKAYLYTNAMKEQKLIKFNQKNETEISIEEFDNFLRDKLKWDSEVEQNKEKEEIKNYKEKTKKEKDKKE